MVLAASFGYNLLLFLHLVAVVVAFGPLLLMGRLAAVDPAGAVRVHLRLSLPALVLVWVFGMGLVGTSETAIDGSATVSMSDAWIALSLLCWVALVAVGVGVIRPAMRRSGPDARSRLMSGIGASHLLMLVAVLLMVFRPGG